MKLQHIVKFVETVSDTASALEGKFESISVWCVSSQLEALPETLRQLQAGHGHLTASTDKRLRELTAVLGSKGAGGAGLGRFGFTPLGPKDRDVFDPRDYKVAELGPKPSIGRRKKWRRDSKCFVDAIGLSWRGTSGLLREVRCREQPFDGSQLHEATADAEKRSDKVPKEFGFEFVIKTDILYRLFMPKLDEMMSAEFA